MTCHAAIPRRAGTKFVCDLDGEAICLEAIVRGNWKFIRAHMKDGTTRDILPDGKPVITRTET